MPSALSSPLAGTWSYRSFVNEPDLNRDFNTLRFGQGTLAIAVADDDAISGSLGGPGWSLAVSGRAASGDPARLRVTGTGEIGGETWIYDYLGYLVPDWPDGVNQRDAIVGSVIRSAPHSGGNAEAGFVASFYAVRQ